MEPPALEEFEILDVALEGESDHGGAAGWI